MSIPLVILGGGSGSGKDTVASFMVKNHGAIGVAQSGPMKRFCQRVFEFTDDQLWGPPSSRNAKDPRPNTTSYWNRYQKNFERECEFELHQICLPGAGANMRAWFDAARKHCYDNEQGMTCRYILQTYGTEFGRTTSKDVWVNYAYNVAEAILSGGHTYTEKEGLIQVPDHNKLVAKWVVITDGRFPNELYKVKKNSGFAIKVDGTNTSAQAQAAGVAGHASETSLESIPSEWYNYVFQNDKSQGLEACEAKVGQLMKLLASPRYL